MAKQSSMKVLQITGKEQFEFITMPVPEPEDREVRIKHLGIVTCNAYDINIYQGKPYPNINGTLTFPYAPGGPGHEWVGMVDKLGPGATQLAIGDWVCLPGGRGEGRGMYPMGYAPISLWRWCEGLNLRRHPGRNFECGEYRKPLASVNSQLKRLRMARLTLAL